MGNLVSMTDFIQLQKMSFRTDQKFRELVIGYANFLQQPLQVSMFFPCDYKGNILEESAMFKILGDVDNDLEQLQYNQAKQRCLFNGVTEDYVYFIIKTYRNIEGLLDVTFDLQLTPTALIQFT